MRKTTNAFVAIAMALCSLAVNASPSSATWRSVNVLGANKGHFYVLVSKRDYPGSYFSYRDRIYIEKHTIRPNRKVFSAVISDVQNTNVDTRNMWISRARTTSTFDLAKYVAKEKIVPLYPRPLDPEYRMVYKEGGLHLERNGRSMLLRELRRSRLAHGTLGVAGVYHHAGYVLLKVFQGDGAQSIDQNYLETVLPVSKDVWNTAKKQLARYERAQGQYPGAMQLYNGNQAQGQTINALTYYAGKPGIKRPVKLAVSTTSEGTRIELFHKEIAYRNDKKATVEFELPRGLKKTGDILLQLTAYNDDKLYSRAVWFEVDGRGGYLNTVRVGPGQYEAAGVVQPGQQKSLGAYLDNVTLSSKKENMAPVNLAELLRKPGRHTISCWVSTYGQYGPGSWVSVSLQFRNDSSN